MLPSTGWRGCVLPTSTRIRKTRAMRKKNDVRRAKVRRVRVAALTVDSEIISYGLGTGEWEALAEELESFCVLCGRRTEVKVGRAMSCRQLELLMTREGRPIKDYEHALKFKNERVIYEGMRTADQWA